MRGNVIDRIADIRPAGQLVPRAGTLDVWGDHEVPSNRLAAPPPGVAQMTASIVRTP